MASAHSSVLRPKKPYPDFPLSWHPSGYWCKKIKGKLHYFGSRHATADEGLEEYVRVRDDLFAGRQPRPNIDVLTVRDLCNHFSTDRQHRLDAGELAQISFDDYRKTCDRLISNLGRNRVVADLRPDDFLKMRSKLATGWAPTTLSNEIQRIRTVFKFAYDADLIERPVRFGPTFKKPSKRVLRKARKDKGPRLFEPDQIRDLLDIASNQMRAMILLGINCGLGNNDCALLPIQAIDFDNGWLNYPRPKTEVDRRCKLWPETVEALRVVLSERNVPTDDALKDNVFVTKYGKPWVQGSDNAVTKEFRKLTGKLDIHRPGLSFYALRHCFETVGGESRDQIAVDAVMGYVRDDMASVYRERIFDGRLVGLADCVRAWLFGTVIKR